MSAKVKAGAAAATAMIKSPVPTSKQPEDPSRSTGRFREGEWVYLSTMAITQFLPPTPPLTFTLDPIQHASIVATIKQVNVNESTLKVIALSPVAGQELFLS